jgi:eukaryotic-like serine/threonine-protein kinase
VKGPPKQLTHDTAADYLPSMSADGKKLAFVSTRSGSEDIWLKDLATGKEKPLVASPAEERAARLSPDGSLVSYSSVAIGAESSDIYIIPTKGGMFQNLCKECGSPWGWSPDNTVLFYNQDRGGRDAIDMINLASGKVGNCLRSTQFDLYLATLTRDSRWITFVALDNRALPSRLEVLAAPFKLENPPKESDWIRVVSDQHWNDKPRWSPHEDRIYFVSDRDGFACLWSQPVEPETKRPVGSPLPLYHIHQIRRSILNVGYALMDIAVAPDKLVLNMGELTGNIWMTKLKDEP